MPLFIGLSLLMFVFFVKYFSETQKKDLAGRTNKHTVFVFSMFTFICTALFFCIKYAAKTSAVALLSVVLYFILKHKKNETETT